MLSLLPLFSIFILSAVICFMAIPVVITISREIGILDSPVRRSTHQDPTPTFGGVAIYIGIMISFCIFTEPNRLSLNVLAGLTLLFFTGIKDDLFAISAVKKIILQLMAAFLVIVLSDTYITSFFGVFGIYKLSPIIGIPFTFLLFIALTNALNLIDGIDGLAGSISLLASLFFGFFFYFYGKFNMACLAFSLAGTVLSFLYYNFSKVNKIFMGDTGSLMLGFILSVFVIEFLDLNVSIYTFKLSIIPIGVLIIPIYDSLRVMMIRIRSRKSPFNPDRNHMHHLFVDCGFSPLKTCVIFNLFTLAITVAMILLQIVNKDPNFIFGFILAGFIGYMYVGKILSNKRVALLRNTRETILEKKSNRSSLPSKPSSSKSKKSSFQAI